MDLIYLAGLIVAIVLFYGFGFWRGYLAQNRLQEFIDNGMVIFDGQKIELREDLSHTDKDRVERERDIFLKLNSTFRSLYKLRQHNAQ